MIISCPLCDKKFEVDVSLIPKEGRLLQCGSCSHQWFYKPQSKTNIPEKVVKLKNEVIQENETISSVEEEKIEVPKKEKIYNESKKDEIDEINREIIINEDVRDDYEKDIKKIKKNKNISFINLLLVLIISFIALVIVIDTFEFKLVNTFPKIELYLDSLYETLKDITSFLLDLF